MHQPRGSWLVDAATPLSETFLHGRLDKGGQRPSQKDPKNAPDCPQI